MQQTIRVMGSPIKPLHWNRYRSRHVQRVVRDITFHYGESTEYGWITLNGGNIQVFWHEGMWKDQVMLRQDRRDAKWRQE